MRRYVLWKTEDGYVFCAEDDVQLHVHVGATLIWSCDAASWEDACTKQHEFLGWEPYKPMR